MSNLYVGLKRKRPILLWASIFIGFSMFAVMAFSVHAAFSHPPESYAKLMRSVNSYSGKSQSLSLNNKLLLPKNEVSEKIEQLKNEEKVSLDKLRVSDEKQKKYFELLEAQSNVLAESNDNSKANIQADSEAKKEIKIPKHPSTFGFSENDITIKKLPNVSINSQKGQKIPRDLRLLASVVPVFPVDQIKLPTIDDLHDDNSEIDINEEVKALARSLNNNPVEIVNYVSSNIVYEPYYGAKKGALGCLKEKVCNDVDSSSLTISILRAAGIPARYEKSAAVFSVEQLKKMFGVDETKTVFAALALNKVPVFILTNRLAGVALDDADFGPERYLVIEWTHVQAFYDYDERGANIPNTLNTHAAATTAELRSMLVGYPKKQWMPIDVVTKPVNHLKRDILADSVGWNAESFWSGFFQYQGELSPFEKYSADLGVFAGRAVADNTSVKSPLPRNSNKLPATLPYFVASAENENINVARETFSELPNEIRQKVTVQLLRDSNDEVVLSKTFYGSELNNQEVNLLYEGLTEVDNAVIEDHNGIPQTPAPLVDIAPYLQLDGQIVSGVEGMQIRPAVSIGESLILKFNYVVAGQQIYTDEKFSVAGNREGIFVSLSKVQNDPELAGITGFERTQIITFKGNSAIAREYLRRLQEDSATIKESLDYELNTLFTRAIVTQNRVLSEVNGVPTTFDFKGFSLDAAAYIVDYSNRGNYKNHQKDFRLLWAQQASYLESKVIQDVTGLESISTVNGLQFAYAHPELYTMHTITSANENDIDSLNLSDNTKANMRAAVGAGDTILTPNTFVTKGEWNGVLYVVLKPDWTGRYAIGEQAAQNGAWSTQLFEMQEYVDSTGYSQPILVASAGFNPLDIVNTYYLDFKTKQGQDGLSCKTTAAEDQQIMADAQWNPSYGYPCLKQTVNFDKNYRHVFIYATSAVKFYGAKSDVGLYNYWETRDAIINKIDAYYAQHIPNGQKFNRWFSTKIGTYLQSVCTSQPGVTACADSDDGSIYYTPKQSGGVNGAAYMARGSFLEKLVEEDDDDSMIVLTLGFPTSDKAQASSTGKQGYYQNFANGQIYQYDSWGMTWTYYTYGKMAQLHDPERDGVVGDIGFPEDDPESSSTHVYQEFQRDNEIEWNKNANTVQVVRYKKYRCELDGDISSPLRLNLILIHGVFDTGVQTLNDLGSLIIPVVKEILSGNLGDDLTKLVNEVQKIDRKSLKNFLATVVDASKAWIIDEYDTAIGPNGCPARASYLTGRIAGEVLLIYVPTSKLTALSKMKAINYAKDTKAISKFAKFTEESMKTFSKWVSKGPFKGSPLHKVSDAYKNEKIFYKDPLNDASGFKLKNAIQDNYLRGDLNYGFYSLQRGLGDEYLKNLSHEGHEIMFVLKENGDMVLAPRGIPNLVEYKMPHPILADGEDIISAGTLKFNLDGSIKVTNESGHYLPNSDSLNDVKSAIKKVDSNINVTILPL